MQGILSLWKLQRLFTHGFSDAHPHFIKFKISSGAAAVPVGTGVAIKILFDKSRDNRSCLDLNLGGEEKGHFSRQLLESNQNVGGNVSILTADFVPTLLDQTFFLHSVMSILSYP